MTEKLLRFLSRPKVLPFLCFWLIGLGTLAGRLYFDVKSYFFGSTLVYRHVSESGYDYLLHLPRGYTDFGEPRPLLIFLHGAGEVGKDVRVLKNMDVAHYAAKEFPFIVVSPLASQGGWEPKRIARLLDEILSDSGKRWELNEKQIYLTGFSMGGFGTYHTACTYPDLFAALAIVASGNEPENAVKIKAPIWAFHGNMDNVVPYMYAAQTIDSMRKSGNLEANLTTLEGRGHDIAGDVYRSPELYRWLLSHERSTTSQ